MANYTVYVGPMWSGKTTRLLLHVDKKIRQNKHVVVFKPELDDRYDISKVVTHNGDMHTAIAVKSAEDIINYISENTDTQVVAVDEAFMIPDISKVLKILYFAGIEIIVSTIDISHSGKILPEVDKILVWATSIEKCVSICSICKNDARYTYKKHSVHNNEIEVGGEDLYEPRCLKHFPPANQLA